MFIIIIIIKRVECGILTPCVRPPRAGLGVFDAEGLHGQPLVRFPNAGVDVAEGGGGAHADDARAHLTLQPLL
eukprot:1601668-Pyramimonas_sp.AAC.1